MVLVALSGCGGGGGFTGTPASTFAVAVNAKSTVTGDTASAAAVGQMLQAYVKGGALATIPADELSYPLSAETEASRLGLYALVSVIAIAHRIRPSQIGRSQRSFCSCVPSTHR